MPPLREHQEDIKNLCKYLLARLSWEMGMTNPGISAKAVEMIRRYDWPGNIRELSNVLKKALIFNRGTPIQPEEITILEPDQNISANEKDGSVLSEIQKWVRASLRSETKENIFDSCIDHVAALLVKEALDFTQGNRSKAAKLLGMSRPTFHSKIEKYDIKIGTAAKK